MNKGTDMREKPSYKDTQKRSASFCRKDWGPAISPVPAAP